MASEKPDLVRLPLLEARGLSLGIGDTSLLRETDFQIKRGELVLLVGVSGIGKTMLLKLIGGVARPGRRGLQADGSLTLDGEDVLHERPRPGQVGIVFQDHALFDELTAHGNVKFALHHRGRRDGSEVSSGALLEELGVRPDARPRTMSGGQLQRLALARTLALAPELILYDEPTTGLDPANARRVATLIHQTHRQHGATSVIVTHNVPALRGIADRVLLLDPEAQKIEEVPIDQVETRLEELQEKARERREAATPPPRQSIPRSFLEGTTQILADFGNALLHLVPRFPRQRYGWRYLRHGLALCASPGAFLYIAVAGVIMGYVATYFTFEHLPKRGFTEPLFIDDILRALGYMLYRVLCPVLVTLLVAARMGAAIASDIGNKVYSRQFDALRSFGVRPARYLLTSVLWAMLISMPLLIVVNLFSARLLSLALFIHGHPDHTAFFWDVNFHRSLRLPDEFLWRGTGWLLLKVELCAFGTAAIAYVQGSKEKMAANDVSRSVTRTIIFASLFVLCVHFAMAFFEF